MRIRDVVGRSGFVFCAVIGLAWALASCASVDQASVTKPRKPPNVAGEKISIPDEELRQGMLGSWIFERYALHRTEEERFPDGRYESVGTVATPEGLLGYTSRGTWRVENGDLVMTPLESTNPIVKGHLGQERRSAITAFTGSEVSGVNQEQVKWTERKKQPENPLLTEFYTKSRLGEFLNFQMEKSLGNFDKTAAASTRGGAQDNTPFLRNLLMAAFKPERLAETILGEFAARMSPEEIRAIIEWEESPLAQRVTALALEAEDPARSDDITAFISDMRQNPPPPERLKLLQELDRTSRITETVVTHMLSMRLTDAAGAMALMPPESRKPLDLVAQEIEKQRPILVTMTEPLVVGERLYVLRSLSDSEFREFMRYCMSDQGRKYSEISMAAACRASLEAEARYWHSLAELSKFSRKTSGT